jgi:hypothetical protein
MLSAEGKSMFPDSPSTPEGEGGQAIAEPVVVLQHGSSCTLEISA